MYDRILVPTDGSEFADDAADTALELATELDAAVHVVCVVESGPLGTISLPGDGASAAEVFEDRATEFVSRIAERAGDRGLEVETEIRRGVPVEEILECADEIAADAIVMGSKGRSGLGRAMLGSVTEGVTRYGTVDVLVVGRNADSVASSASVDER
ncbi:universal stress protein [Natrarchaeobius oligotrophus]|uniref:Universal stress protein n=1 Tax=Natrarchaeobius chitinivorans TaxID=1679083 RepID=A0A3N6PLV6_NATCH|nr:universal stress protein [Natrarchaeobius chitinivorans]RQH02500.1 universal stress protein [Natrarchaeobius chitinivorans]